MLFSLAFLSKPLGREPKRVLLLTAQIEVAGVGWILGRVFMVSRSVAVSSISLGQKNGLMSPFCQVLFELLTQIIDTQSAKDCVLLSFSFFCCNRRHCAMNAWRSPPGYSGFGCGFLQCPRWQALSVCNGVKYQPFKGQQSSAVISYSPIHEKPVSGVKAKATGLPSSAKGRFVVNDNAHIRFSLHARSADAPCCGAEMNLAPVKSDKDNNIVALRFQFMSVFFAPCTPVKDNQRAPFCVIAFSMRSSESSAWLHQSQVRGQGLLLLPSSGA